MEELSIYNNMLPHFSQKEIEEAEIEISKHKQGASNNNKIFIKSIGAEYNDDFTRKSIKRSYLKECRFINANFNRAAATGSVFRKSIFKNCNFENANFQYCDFSESKFLSSKEIVTQGCNFSESDFSYTTFDGMNFIANSFSRALFDNTIITGCNILSSTFENAIFHNAIFKDLELRNLNLDYADFLNVKMDNVILPFSQIPYIFGCLEYLVNTKDKVLVSSKKDERNIITIEEYVSELKNLEIYYSSINEFFPLANIYLSKGMHDNAFQAILNGLFFSIQFKNFRQLKYFCKLASRDNSFTDSQLSKLYSKIIEWMPVSNFTNSEYHRYGIHIGEIRNILLNERTNCLSTKITIKTNIEERESNKLAVLVDSLNKIITDIDKNNKFDFLEIRHNSPYELFIQITAGIAILSPIISLIYSILSNGIKLKSEIWELKNKKLDYKLKEIKLSKEVLKIPDTLKKENIQIKEINHFSSGVNTTEIDNWGDFIVSYQLKSEIK